MILAGFYAYIPTFVFLILLLLAVLRGLRRGFRKSLILFINAIIAFIICLIVCQFIFKGDFDRRIVELANKFHLNLQDLIGTRNSYKCLSGYIYEKVIEQTPTDYMSEQTLIEAISMLMAIAEAVVKVLMFFVMLLVYAILKFLFYIVYLIFFKEKRHKKRIEEQYSEGVVQRPYSKKRSLGALVGLTRGLVSVTILFSFIGSLFYLATGGVYSSKTQTVVVNVDGSQYDVTEYVDVVNRYGAVGIGKIYESIKVSDNVPLYLLIADNITKGSYIAKDLDGNPITDEEGNVIKGSVYMRRELGPITGVVKEALLKALSYDFDMGKIDDTDYLIWFMSDENVKEGVPFNEELDKIVDEYNFGKYTLFLGQCLLNSVASSVAPDNVDDNTSFTNKLLYTLFKGENKIDASMVLNNENLNSILHMTINIVSKYDDIEGFIKSFDTSTNDSKLLYGVKRASYRQSVITDVINHVSDTLLDLSFMKSANINALLSDVTILVINELLPDFSTSGIDNKDDKYSIYNINWNQSLKSIFDTIIDAVDFIASNELTNVDGLLDKLIDSLDDTTSKAFDLVDSILSNALVGCALNAKGFRDLINDIPAVQKLNITLPTDIPYGSYYDGGACINGEIFKLIDTLKSKVKVVYDIVSDDKKTTTDVLNELLSSENGLVGLLTGLVDKNSDSYSKLIHYVASSAIMSMDEITNAIKIYVPTSSLTNDNGNIIIASSELTAICNALASVDVGLFSEDFDYKKLLTSDVLNALMGSKILRATVAVTLYAELDKQEEISSHIPQSYALDTEQHIKDNIDKWVKNGGELSSIVDAITESDIIYDLINVSDFSNIKWEDLIGKITPNAMKNLMQSNVLNCIVTYELQSISISNAAIIVPIEAQSGKLDGLERISPQKAADLVTVIKDSGFIDVINSKDAESLVISKLTSLSDTVKLEFADCEILNATLTNFIRSSKFGEYQINIPNEALKKASVPMVTYEEFSNLLKPLNSILGEELSFAKINYNNLINEQVFGDISRSMILSSTIINILIELSDDNETVQKYLAIPDVYLNNDMLNYTNTRWYKHDELNLLLNDLLLIGASFDDDNNISIDESKIMKLTVNATSPNSGISKLIASDILHLSISKIIRNLDSVLVVSGACDSIGDSTWIKTDELLKFFSMIEIIVGTDKLNSGITMDELSDLITIDYLKENGKLTANTLRELTASVILEATISNIIIKNTENKIIIPDEIKFTSEEDSNIYSWLSVDNNGAIKSDKGELQRAIDALDILNLMDVITSGEISIGIDVIKNLSDEELDSILESRLIHATCVKVLYDSILNTIEVPSMYLECAVKAGESYTLDEDKIRNDFSNLNIVKNNEIKKIITDVRLLGLDLATLTFDVNLVLSLDEEYKNGKTKLEVMSESDIIWYTMSNYLLDVESLDIPTDDISILRYNQYPTDTYLEYDEVLSIIKVAKELGITDDFSVGFSVNKILDVSIDNLCGSKIIWYTMSNKIFSLSSLELPSLDITYTSKGYDYVTKEELAALVGGMKMLDITDTEADFDVNKIFNILGDNKNNVEELCESKIIWYTMTNNIVGQDSLDVPHGAYDRNYTNYDYIITDELYALTSTISELCTDDISSFDYNNFLKSGNNSKLWDSLIIRYTVSQKIIENDTLKVVVDVVETYYSYDNEYFITKSELALFMNAITVMNLSDLDNVDVNLIMVNNHKDTLFNSELLSSSISYAMFEAGNILDVSRTTKTKLVGSNDDYFIMNISDMKEYVEVAVACGMSTYDSITLEMSASLISVAKYSRIFMMVYNSTVIEAITYHNSLCALLGKNYVPLTYEDAFNIVRYEDGFKTPIMTDMVSENSVNAFVAEYN